MRLTPDQLADEIAELKRLVMAKDAELTSANAELVAARNGLIVSALTVEKLKAQIAKLKRQMYGARSERIEREIEQLELLLEETQAAAGAALASEAVDRRRSHRASERRRRKSRAASCQTHCPARGRCTRHPSPAPAMPTNARSTRASPRFWRILSPRRDKNSAPCDCTVGRQTQSPWRANAVLALTSKGGGSILWTTSSAYLRRDARDNALRTSPMRGSVYRR